jgi:hypothetical protein
MSDAPSTPRLQTLVEHRAKCPLCRGSGGLCDEALAIEEFGKQILANAQARQIRDEAIMRWGNRPKDPDPPYLFLDRPVLRIGGPVFDFSGPRPEREPR